MKTVNPKENMMAESGKPMMTCSTCGQCKENCVCKGLMESSKKK